MHGRKAEWQSRHGAASEAAAEHFDHLRLVRPENNVPHSSFEAQEKQLVGPREVPCPSKRHAFESCCGGL